MIAQHAKFEKKTFQNDFELIRVALMNTVIIFIQANAIWQRARIYVNLHFYFNKKLVRTTDRTNTNLMRINQSPKEEF